MANDSTTSTPPASGPPVQRSFSTFSSLQYRDYRFLWFGQIGRAAAMWMEQIARPVLILQLTDSELMLGLVVAARMTPQLLFGLIAGVAADRFDRKRIIVLAQIATMAFHFITAALVLTDVVQAWHVFALAFATGTSMVFNQTARQSLIPQLVPEDQVLNAISLNMAALNVMRIAGPGLAAFILLGGDVGPVYLTSGILGAGVLLCLSMVRIKHEPRQAEEESSWFDDLRAGLDFVRRRPEVLAVLGPPMIMFIFGMPYITVFLPLFAKDVLDLGNAGVGALMAVTGAGAIVGSLVLASQSNLRHRGLLLMAFMATFSALMIVFSQTTYLPLSILLLMAAASMSTSFMALTNSLLLQLSPSDMHGRVVSLMSIDRGLVPIGAIAAGALAASMGAQDALLIVAAVCLGLTIVATIAIPPLRRI
ncbi:MAG: MFS transporter [Chloroflexi bacterium]|nr:MFS transporter [Chloroflexota bacterium]